MALPPLPFEVNVTMAEFVPSVTALIDGAAGAVPATNDDEAAEKGLSAIELLASALQV